MSTVFFDSWLVTSRLEAREQLLTALLCAHSQHPCVTRLGSNHPPGICVVLSMFYEELKS